LVPAAWADLDVNGETYAIIAFPALHGETPRHPWQPRELSAALNTVHRISEELTPSPWPDSPGDRRLLEFFTWWGAISDDAHDPWRANPWVADKLPALLAAEGQLLAELPGNTLTHTDLRADNIVMTPTGVWFVDWAHAQNAARWVDAGLLMGDVIASRADVGDGGPIDIACIIAEHPSLNTVSSETIWRLQVGLAGALHGLSRQPSPPGLPTIRSWQAATADRLIRWCQRESPLG
jgi:thiamine kinase-like enzyme